MKKIAIIAALLLSTPCFAEDTKPVDAAKPAEAPKAEPAKTEANPGPYFFLLDAQDLNVIAGGLNEVVKKLADPVLQKMNNQLVKQVDVINAAKAK